MFTDFRINSRARYWIAIPALATAGLIGALNYETAWLYFWATQVEFRPALISGIISACTLGLLYLRMIYFQPCPYGLVTLALNAFVLAILGEAVLGAAGTMVSRVPMPYLIAAAIFTAAVGLRDVATIAWIAAAILASINLVSASDAMGINGFFFVILVGAGMIVQSNLRFDGTTFWYEFRGDLGNLMVQRGTVQADQKVSLERIPEYLNQ